MPVEVEGVPAFGDLSGCACVSRANMQQSFIDDGDGGALRALDTRSIAKNVNTPATSQRPERQQPASTSWPPTKEQRR